jgi:hypothetical protein
MNILKRVLQHTPSETALPSAKPAAEPTSLASESEEKKTPPPPQELNNYIVVVLDSCRYDTLMAASPHTLSRLGTVERRWSYASWTAPSHYNLLMGLLPHSSPQHVYAS